MSAAKSGIGLPKITALFPGYASLHPGYKLCHISIARAARKCHESRHNGFDMTVRGQ